MKFLFALLALAFSSCAATKVTERKAVPPRGSGDQTDMPWSVPGEGSSQGAFQGMGEGR